MILQLDKTHRVVGTALCWQLETLTVTKGKARWRPHKYFPDLGSALRQAVRDEIRTAPVEGVREAIEAADSVVQRYASLIDGAADEVAAKIKRVAA